MINSPIHFAQRSNQTQTTFYRPGMKSVWWEEGGRSDCYLCTSLECTQHSDRLSKQPCSVRSHLQQPHCTNTHRVALVTPITLVRLFHVIHTIYISVCLTTQRCACTYVCTLYWPSSYNFQLVQDTYSHHSVKILHFVIPSTATLASTALTAYDVHSREALKLRHISNQSN